MRSSRTNPGPIVRYRYLDKWDKRDRNRPVETEILRANLERAGYSSVHISDCAGTVQTAADTTGRPFTKPTWHLLTATLRRGGGDSRRPAHDHCTRVDWEHPRPRLALAEEVALRRRLRAPARPGALCEGIAIAVIELKRSSSRSQRHPATDYQSGKIFNKEFFRRCSSLCRQRSQGVALRDRDQPEEILCGVEGAQEAGPRSGRLLDGRWPRCARRRVCST